MSDRLVAEDTIYTTYNKHNRRSSMPSPGLELATIANKRLQTYAFDGRPLTSVESIFVGIYKTIRNKCTGRKCISLTYLIENNGNSRNGEVTHKMT